LDASALRIFVRRNDVDNLLADPEYRKHAARGKKAQYPTG
jgi:hypothetical protein